jgi:hypothetical protein
MSLMLSVANKPFMLSVIMLNVVMLNAVALSSPGPILFNFFGKIYVTILTQILEFTPANYSKSSYIVSAPGA